MSRGVISASVLLAASIAGGCRDQVYSLEVWNTSTEKLTEVEVRYGETQSAQFGVLPPGKSGVRNDIHAPVPNLVEVSWISGVGKVKVVSVDVTPVLPANYNEGQLTFRIHPDQSVTAHYQKMDLEIP